MTLLIVWAALARFTAGLFAGSCLYVLWVVMPVRRAKPPELAHPDFVASLARSERLQPPLHIVSLLATLLACSSGAGRLFLAGLAVLLPILPLSLIWARPVYVRLRKRLPTDPSVQAELAQFARIHRLRTILAVLGFLLLAA
ncbi:MAG TPA: DUF1772 domain-containing protein [Pseudomonadota bacterium]|nr:DUF1772 domain-containing protein [Pseudomonadota bacterium]